jgi:8-oxo-dGTP pyrophosphatase MutT (NUDIX family)
MNRANNRINPSSGSSKVIRDEIYHFQDFVAAMRCPDTNVKYAFENLDMVWMYLLDNERNDENLAKLAWPKEWYSFCPATMCRDPGCCRQELGKCGTMGCEMCIEGQVHLCTSCGEYTRHRARHCPRVVREQPTQSLCASFNNMSVSAVPKSLTLRDTLSRLCIGAVSLNVTYVGVMLLCNTGGGVYILCGKRANWLKNGDRISSPGGEVNYREQPMVAAGRELKEESGFEADSLHCFLATGGNAVFVGLWNGKNPEFAEDIDEVQNFAADDVPRGVWFDADNMHRWVELDWLVKQKNNPKFVNYFINNCITLKNKLDSHNQ